MLDIKDLRNDLVGVFTQLEKRGFYLDKEEFTELETKRKVLQIEEQNLRALRKAGARAIGQAKKANNLSEEQKLMQSLATCGDRLDMITAALHQVQANLQKFYMAIPNLPDQSVPLGKLETDSKELKVWGAPPKFDFKHLDHVALGLTKGLNLEVATRISGSRFSVLVGKLARLHRALGQFMLDLHINEHGYEEILAPVVVNASSLRGTGQLPKFAEDLFRLDGKADFYLLPTAEVSVTNIVRERIIAAQELPIKYVCQSQCFRREVGSYGRDTHGLIRQHQFEKVELVQIVRAEESWDTLEQLTRHAEIILERLQIPYRKMALCAGDIGFAAAKTYDLEVWIPSQNKYREISSCSNCLDFQARRMQARWRDSNGKLNLVHTLNGSGVAIGRALVAIMENYQDEAGNIKVPEVLIPYMGGITIISD